MTNQIPMILIRDNPMIITLTSLPEPVWEKYSSEINSQNLKTRNYQFVSEDLLAKLEAMSLRSSMPVVICLTRSSAVSAR